MPGGPGVRLDTHCRAGYRVPPHYDSMVGKLIAHARSRDEAVARMQRSLDEFHIAPIQTTIPLHRRLLDNAHFLSGEIDIHFVERLLGGGDEL